MVLIGNDEIINKAGAGVKSTISGTPMVTDWSAQAECFVNNATRNNWSDLYAALNVDVKSTLDEAIENLAAIYCIQYDMGGYTSRTEAEIMINVLKQRADECIAILIDKKGESFTEGA